MTDTRSQLDRDAHGNTALMRAAWQGDHQNLTGVTCLMYAASSGKPEVLRAVRARPEAKPQ